jgi:hypothetical protein
LNVVLRILFWLPPVILGCCAASIDAGMPTGNRNYDAWQSLRAYLLWAAGLYIPVALLIRRISRPRQTPGIVCDGCGYNLRATPERCPKCGMLPKNLGRKSN